MNPRSAISAVAIAVLALACAGRTRVAPVPTAPPTAEQMAELWVDPGSQPRDLFYGIGGKQYAPSKDAMYKFKAKDELGSASAMT